MSNYRNVCVACGVWNLHHSTVSLNCARFLCDHRAVLRQLVVCLEMTTFFVRNDNQKNDNWKVPTGELLTRCYTMNDHKYSQQIPHVHAEEAIHLWEITKTSFQLP